jgi:integrase
MKKQPIRDLEVIESIKLYLHENNRLRDRFLFVLGINLGRRIGDIINLKVRDIRSRDHINLKEQKTGKTARLKLTPKIKTEIKRYCEGKEQSEFLFPSRQKKNGKEKAISYDRAYQILMDIFKKFKIEDGGTHTLRKTFGYWYYQRTKDIETLRKIFNHSSIQVTRIYIGIEADEIDNSMISFGGL